MIKEINLNYINRGIDIINDISIDDIQYKEYKENGLWFTSILFDLSGVSYKLIYPNSIGIMEDDIKYKISDLTKYDYIRIFNINTDEAEGSTIIHYLGEISNSLKLIHDELYDNRVYSKKIKFIRVENGVEKLLKTNYINYTIDKVYCNKQIAYKNKI